MEESNSLSWHLSARDGGLMLVEQPRLQASNDDDGPATRVWIDPDRQFQEIEGFGGAFTEAAATTWMKLGACRQHELLEAYFDADTGHGYSFCRVHMNSCDFALGNYAHAEVPGDVALRHFSIARDEHALIPFIQAAQRTAPAPIRLLASPWSPPAWMKSNGQMNGGGKLLSECSDVWARCFVKFIQAYAEHGIPIWGVTVQNEPMAVQRWDSCIYSAAEERDFIRDHLGPTLQRAGLGHVQIVIWDHNRDEMVERASVVLSDPQVARRVWGTGFHWYVEDHFDHVQLVHDGWPDKKLLFTEGCQEGGPHRGEWALGERYAHAMINDLNRWTAGWIDWNLLLDATGGPNHAGNLCSAPILADLDHNILLPQSSYAYIGHFSRFARAGARRILCAANKQILQCTAFIHPDRNVAVVVMNRSEEVQQFTLRSASCAWNAYLPPRSIATYQFTAQSALID